ncbi:Uncharacterised protein [Chlamydia abortus]|uniref:Uncharacterized protein n=1 Tax=Paenibacillus residui TaxID=629724 RepID=A0ABW3D7S6_9BACL|nr:Uncharacterised protein [Chlamydia abortus]
MKERLEQTDWAKAAVHAMEIHRILTEKLVPEAARAHFRRAEQEALLGVHSWLDSKIEQIGREDERRASPRETPLKSIPIEDE